MKLQFRIIFLLLLLFAGSLSFAQGMAKKKHLSPFQVNIDKCFAGKVSVTGLTDNMKLYLEIVKKFPLQASETTFRELVYIQNGQKKKLRLEDGVVQVFNVAENDEVKLVETEDLNKAAVSNGMRYKVNSAEARLNQLLNRANIKSDYVKTTEYRSQEVVLQLVWDNGKIKSMSVEFGVEKPKLECLKKSAADICDCRS